MGKKTFLKSNITLSGRPRFTLQKKKNKNDADFTIK